MPTIWDWVQSLKNAPRVDGEWPTLAGPWHQHWAWQAREEERMQERKAHEEAALAEVVESQSPDQD